MTKAKRTIKVLESGYGTYTVAIERNEKEKYYFDVSRRRIKSIADCLRVDKFTTRPFRGNGLGYVAEEN